MERHDLNKVSFFRLGEEYQQIAEKALSIPETTEDLMKHIAYAVKIETEVVYQMEDRLREVFS